MVSHILFHALPQPKTTLAALSLASRKIHNLVARPLRRHVRLAYPQSLPGFLRSFPLTLHSEVRQLILGIASWEVRRMYRDFASGKGNIIVQQDGSLTEAANHAICTANFQGGPVEDGTVDQHNYTLQPNIDRSSYKFFAPNTLYAQLIDLLPRLPMLHTLVLTHFALLMSTYTLLASLPAMCHLRISGCPLPRPPGPSDDLPAPCGTSLQPVHCSARSSSLHSHPIPSSLTHHIVTEYLLLGGSATQLLDLDTCPASLLCR